MKKFLLILFTGFALVACDEYFDCRDACVGNCLAEQGVGIFDNQDEEIEKICKKTCGCVCRKVALNGRNVTEESVKRCFSESDVSKLLEKRYEKEYD